MERGGSVGLGHRRRQLQEPHHGPLHRVPGQPGPIWWIFQRLLRSEISLGLADNVFPIRPKANLGSEWLLFIYSLKECIRPLGYCTHPKIFKVFILYVM